MAITDKKRMDIKKPVSPQKQPMKISPLLVLIIIAAVITGTLIGFLLNQASKGTGNTSTTNTANKNTAVKNTNVTTNINTGANANTNTSTTVTTNAWNIAEKVSSPNLLPSTWSPTTGEDGEAEYYKVGTVKTTKYSGATVVMVTWYSEGPQFYPYFSYFLQLKDGTYVYPTKANAKASETPLAKIFPQKTVVDTSYDPEIPEAPKTITGPEDHQTLTLDETAVGFFSDDKLTVAFTDPAVGSVYWYGKKAYVASATSIGSIPITLRGGFTVRSPIGLAWVYRLKFDFFGGTTVDESQYSGVPSLTWTDGSANKSRYVVSKYGGCGVLNYADVADAVPMTSLKKVGAMSTGESVYEYIDSNATELKNHYSNTYQVVDGDTKVSYATFIASRPIIFVVDSFGRMVRMTNNAYAPMVECGKPVIYLYPEKTTNISVQLKPAGGFTKTEPAYGSGWNVVASPNGQLKNLADGKTYPYLFWEGRGGIYPEMDQGFVVAQQDVHTFLVTSLAKLGLNDQESKDFIEFWEPLMKDSPYYKVSFHGTDIMDQLAPLSISPKPDTIIRILMDYKPLDKKISLKPQRLGHIPRTGYTVIEWGGVLR